MAGLSLNGINKVYENGFHAVKDVDLNIEDKEFIVLVGPSGCGKTTTLRMIAGLEDITSGELYISDKRVNTVAPKDRDIAMVFQNYALYPHMSVYDNMAFALKLRKMPKKEIRDRVEEAAKILDIEHLLDRKPKILSGGQKQRVALGRAIVRHAKVFLMDEPLSNLDAKLRVQMRAELIKLHQRLATTFVYVTHDQTEAMTMGNRIVVMKDGIIQQIADPQTIYDSPANLFVAGFIGSPQMNFIEGNIFEEDESIYFQFSTYKIGIPRDRIDKSILTRISNTDVILGIRPEDISAEFSELDHGLDAINARVEVMELMGAERYLYLEVDEKKITARVKSNFKPQIGEYLSLYFEGTRIHIFDSITEQAII